MFDPGTIATWIVVISAAGGAVVGAVKFLFWAFDEWQKRKKHEGFAAPSKTLQLAAKMEGSCRWDMGKNGDEPSRSMPHHLPKCQSK